MSETIFELDTMLDQSDMRGAITEFPNQIKESFSIMSTWKAQQEYQNIEVIIVDNESTDRTVIKAQEFPIKLVEINKFLP